MKNSISGQKSLFELLMQISDVMDSKCFCGKNDCKTCKDDHVVILSIMALYGDENDPSFIT